MLTVPFTVCLKANQEIEGTAVGLTMLQKGEKHIPKVMVLWDDDSRRSPAPSFHDPAELEWLDIPTLSALEGSLALAEMARQAQEGQEEEAAEPEVVTEGGETGL